MDASKILLAAVSIVMLIEGAGLMLFTKKMRKLIDKMYKNEKIVKEIGLIEIIASLAIILIIFLI
ncbi:DUF2065 family protein [Candidatus Pacearchaeota archaeon]|nr:DUF2065 family protein [Candidatus Pacearchaeota archaeon]